MNYRAGDPALFEGQSILIGQRLNPFDRLWFVGCHSFGRRLSHGCEVFLLLMLGTDVSVDPKTEVIFDFDFRFHKNKILTYIQHLFST